MSNNDDTPATPAEAGRLAIERARQDALPIAELIQTAQTLADAGEAALAATLYRTWLAHAASPLAYAVHFNLAVLAGGQGDAAGAEAAYRDATALQPGFAAAWLNLGLLLEAQQRPADAMMAWHRLVVQGSTDGATGHLHYQLARDHLARLAERYPALAPDAPARVEGLALVSILLPTHNRPDFAELALNSALAQTYPNIEIIVSDNSDDELTRERLAPYLVRYPRVRYSRIASCPPMENFHNAYTLARGEYINFLMDDDLFHPEKIQRMAPLLQRDPQIGLVTSSRQLINLQGHPMASPPEFAPIYNEATRLNGVELGAHLINGSGNIIGEPTTVLFRRAIAGPRFGVYTGRPYSVMSDIATWLNVLEKHDCIYLPEGLSFFRIHEGQGQRERNNQIRGTFEWNQLVCDACAQRVYISAGPRRQEMLAEQLRRLATLAVDLRPDLLAGIYDADKVIDLIRQTASLYLQP